MGIRCSTQAKTPKADSAEKTLLAQAATKSTAPEVAAANEAATKETVPEEAAANEAKGVIEAALYVTLASASSDGQTWASPVAFWPTSKGLCFATSPASLKALNLASNPQCSLSIFDSQAQFMTGCGVQCSGDAAVVPPELWPQALSGISPRLPNIKDDIVEQHIGLFTMMGYVLIEVTVASVFINLFNPTKGGDHRIPVEVDWSGLHVSPFSLATSLGPPPVAPDVTPQSIVETALYATLASANQDKEPWASPVAFWPTTQGLCFATPKESLKAKNLGTRSCCGLSIFDSRAPFMTGTGLQCVGNAAAAPPDRWPVLLEGIRGRFPNFEGDVVEQHVGLFTMMDYALIEVTVDKAFINRFDPEKGGDHRVEVTVDWDGLKTSEKVAPFSLAKALGPA